MILRDIRIKFRDLSGRYDLVNDDGSDNGADFYINDASRWLDKTVETQKTGASYMTIIEAGTWYIKFPQARAVKEVWVSTVEGKWQLTKKSIQDLMAEFFADPPAEWTNGTPEYYCPALTRHIPEDVTPAKLAEFAAYIGIIPVMAHDYNAIILSTPVDQSTLVEVVGLFYSSEMSEDDDENFWAKTNPLLLIQSAIRQTYVVSGNKPHLEIMETGMAKDMVELDKDVVEQAIAEADQMEG